VTELPNGAESLHASAGRAELNGETASADDLRVLALQNYGHFSTMRVVGGGVRGLDLHLARLDAATRELFGCALEAARVRECLRHIVGDRKDALALRITVFSRSFKRDRPGLPSKPDVLITMNPARAAEQLPIRLKSFAYERVSPRIKHVGTFELFHHRRLAQIDGFDDALFIDSSGAVSEASVWNIGFFDGQRVAWPNAPALAGVSMQLLQEGLRERGVASESRRIAYADIGKLRSAFVSNALHPVRAVAAIDDSELVVDRNLIAMLEACHESRALQPI